MKIALVHNLPSGGAKRVLYEHVLWLRRSHTLDLFRFDVTDERYFDLTSLVNRVDTVNLKHTWLGRMRYGMHGPKLLALPMLKAAGRELARRIDAGGYDLAFVHGCVELNNPYVLQFLKTPSVYYCQQPYRGLEPLWDRPGTGAAIAGLLRKLYSRIDADNARAADVLLAPSYFCRETLYRIYGVFSNVSHLGVDPDLFRPTGAERTRTILAVGSLGAHKAQDLLIRSAARITPRPTVSLVYNWADSGVEDRLRSLAGELGVPLELNPGVTDERLVNAYNTAAVVVSTSVMELFGLTALEAMACGAPVVAVNEGGYRESVVDGVTGFLVDRDEVSLSAALARLLDDTDLGQRFGAEAREIVLRRWTWHHALTILDRHLESALASARHHN